MKRIKGVAAFTLIGGIMRFSTMPKAVAALVDGEVCVPEGDSVQYVAALGAGVLGHLRLRRLAAASR